MTSLEMNVDVLDRMIFEVLTKYFKSLSHTGYKDYDTVFSILVLDFLHEIFHTDLKYYVSEEDSKLIQNLIYQLSDNICEINIPDIPCCCTSTTTTPSPPSFGVLNIGSNADGVIISVDDGEQKKEVLLEKDIITKLTIKIK